MEDMFINTKSDTNHEGIKITVVVDLMSKMILSG